MDITPEQQPEFARELDKFPSALRELVQAELAAGNAIEEIGHSFPAPAIGAYIKLARVLVTRQPVSGQGLDFRARNSATSSGEFTDSERHFFVLLPPVPDPEMPSMDAIRKAHAPPDQPLGGEGAPDRLPYKRRYKQLTDKPAPIPAELDTVEALQRAIVQGLKQGARFSKSDRDGCGSDIVWRSGAFVSSDWGDRPAQESSANEADLWRMLRAFSHFERWRAERTGPLSELDTWRLIWRLMGPV